MYIKCSTFIWKTWVYKVDEIDGRTAFTRFASVNVWMQQKQFFVCLFVCLLMFVRVRGWECFYLAVLSNLCPYVFLGVSLISPNKCVCVCVCVYMSVCVWNPSKQLHVGILQIAVSEFEKEKNFDRIVRIEPILFISLSLTLSLSPCFITSESLSLFENNTTTQVCASENRQT